MGSTAKQNSTTFIRCPKDEQHPFNRVPAKLYSLNGYHLAIMAQILSNKEGWNLVKYEIGKRLGFPERKFLKAWKELEDMGYIQITKKWGSYHYTIYEDPCYTTGTGADCVTHTTGSSTGCIGAILTTSNNNYNYNTDTSVTDATCLKIKFNELNELYPASVTSCNGQTNFLKSKIENCEKEYVSYLLKQEKSHEQIMDCLKRELDERKRTGNTKYQPALLRWIKEKRWKVYEQKNIESTERYGQIIE